MCKLKSQGVGLLLVLALQNYLWPQEVSEVSGAASSTETLDAPGPRAPMRPMSLSTFYMVKARKVPDLECSIITSLGMLEKCQFLQVLSMMLHCPYIPSIPLCRSMGQAADKLSAVCQELKVAGWTRHICVPWVPKFSCHGHSHFLICSTDKLWLQPIHVHRVNSFKRHPSPENENRVISWYWRYRNIW